LVQREQRVRRDLPVRPDRTACPVLRVLLESVYKAQPARRGLDCRAWPAQPVRLEWVWRDPPVLPDLLDLLELPELPELPELQDFQELPEPLALPIKGRIAR
jgi:hypothetical protein